MNVITNRRVLTEDTSNCCGMSSFDDYSYAKGKGKKPRSGKFKEKLQGGYTKVKEAGGLSFLENVLGLNQQAQNQGICADARITLLARHVYSAIHQAGLRRQHCVTAIGNSWHSD